MATSIDQFVRELRSFRERKAVLRELRVGIRRPFPVVRDRIRKWAVATLPSGGGLGKWVASSRITLRIKASSRAASVTVVGGRNSRGGRSDLNAIDRGRVRAPSWGHRGKGAWHTQSVTPGFFSTPVTEADEWREAIEESFDTALDQIRRG